MAAASVSDDASSLDISAATQTLDVLSTIHEAKFGLTPMNKQLRGALRGLEIAGYVSTFSRDPRQGISEAVSGELIGAMNINRVLFGLNVAGDVSVAILPTLRNTAEALKKHDEAAYTEYLEAMALFEVLAAYRQGVTYLVETIGDGVSAMVMDMPKFSRLAVEKGGVPPSISAAKKETLTEEITELGQQLGESLQTDERVKPLLVEYSSSLSLGDTATASLSRTGAGSFRTVTKKADFKPSDIKVGVSLFGSTSAGIGAALTVSMPTNPISLTVGALALIGLAIANIFNKKKHKKEVKKFRKRTAEIDAQIRAMINNTNDICNSDIPDADKIVRLRTIADSVEGFVRHKGVITGLDHILGADAARSIGDGFRKILRDLRSDINEKIIPAIEKRQVFIQAIGFIDANDFVKATPCLALVTAAQKEFCEAYISLKKGDMSAVTRLERLKETECRVLVDKLLEQCSLPTAARSYMGAGAFRSSAGAGSSDVERSFEWR